MSKESVRRFCFHPFTTTERIIAWGLLVMVGDLLWSIAEPIRNGWHWYHPIVQVLLLIGIIGTIHAWKVHYTKVISKRPSPKCIFSTTKDEVDTKELDEVHIRVLLYAREDRSSNNVFERRSVG